MSNTAIIGLSDETLATLRELRRLNVDSAKGFEECADLIEDHGIKQVFVEIAHDRRQQAQALATQIEWNDEADDEKGSYLGLLHRSWVIVREACSSDSTASILAEVQRGEETIASAYDDAIAACVGSPIIDTLAEQATAVGKALGRIKSLIGLE